MKNDKFNNLSEKQKRQKLKFILKETTQGYLKDEELVEIIEKVKLNRQYIIKLYLGVEDFETAAFSPKIWNCEVVLGTVEIDANTGVRLVLNKEQPAALVIRPTYEGGDCKLHIYIPKDRRPKGKKRQDLPKVLCQQNCVDEKYICQHVEYREDSLFCAFSSYQEGRSNA